MAYFKQQDLARIEGEIEAQRHPEPYDDTVACRRCPRRYDAGDLDIIQVPGAPRIEAAWCGECNITTGRARRAIAEDYTS